MGLDLLQSKKQQICVYMVTTLEGPPHTLKKANLKTINCNISKSLIYICKYELKLL